MSCTKTPDQITELVLDHTGLARSLARRFVGRGERQDDLEQVANLALLGAARRFDADRGVSFSTFATVSVLGELKRHFRDHLWWVRAPRRLHDLFLQVGEARETLHHELGHSPSCREIGLRIGCSPEEVIEAMEAADGYRPGSLDAQVGPDSRPLIDELGAEDDDLRVRLDHVQLCRDLEILDDRERWILKRYFYDDRTQLEIATELDCSQMQVSRWMASILARLRHRATEVA